MGKQYNKKVRIKVIKSKLFIQTKLRSLITGSGKTTPTSKSYAYFINNHATLTVAPNGLPSGNYIELLTAFEYF